jgi:outer membrane protein assembly factor BamC
MQLRNPWIKAALVVSSLLLGAMLGACGSFSVEGAKIDYKSASKMPSLEIPPDLTRPSTDDRFDMPDVSAKNSATYSEYSRSGSQRVSTGGASNVLPQSVDARIERDGSQRWLVVKATPDQAWGVVKDFWVETGFIVNVEVPEGGVMETDWAENRAKIPDAGWLRSLVGKWMDMAFSTSERDKFRTRLERGTEPGTTEIYISHRGMQEVYVDAQQDRTMWQPRASDPNLEVEMLGRLMARFGTDQVRVKAQIAAPATVPQRAKLGNAADGTRTLALDDQFDRAWRRVGLALDRVGFTVEDRDRSKGLYYVRYVDPQIDNKAPQQGGGWFSWLKFWDGGEKPKQLEQFRIEIKDTTGGSQVKVLGKDGVQESPAIAGKVLTLLYEQLK